MKNLCLLSAVAVLLIAALAFSAPSAGIRQDPEPAPVNTESIPVWQFFHGIPDALETAVIKGYTVDCEIGPVEYELSESEAERIRTLAMRGVVTGRENDTMVTGGTWLYSFETPDGAYIMSVELYKGLLVGRDGMYGYEIAGE